ncbi:DUF1398 family protein [Niabella yanshanensis]|uniref:DUF1398 family protein n=1 Tax=Niabella yanshanensis TaxID=577386 RepID=A0ABZ0WC28_9BACT|nr:DUF1398 family protein [Niabella yanshanensis]WQD40614.1 DUF1398 family protein [Niabella yanshanensis]
MFTVAQVKQAHIKVQSGADFPAYIQEIKALGVTGYEAFVSDGHITYFGANGFQTSAGPKYPELVIAELSDKDQFQADLKAHQQGNTDYPTFCSDCARSGIEKWMVEMGAMTCTYYDKSGNKILVEVIPH